MSKELKDMSLDELAAERKKFQDKIEGPENDGRVTSDGSVNLDYWMDMVDELTDEINKKIADDKFVSNEVIDGFIAARRKLLFCPVYMENLSCAGCTHTVHMSCEVRNLYIKAWDSLEEQHAVEAIISCARKKSKVF